MTDKNGQLLNKVTLFHEKIDFYFLKKPAFTQFPKYYFKVAVATRANFNVYRGA